MRIALLPDDRPISIEALKSLPDDARPTELRCAAATTLGLPCLGKAWTVNLDSKVRSPWFAARHVSECTAHVSSAPSEAGDAGHTVDVVRRDVLRITRGRSHNDGESARHEPDASVPGTGTQRLMPARPGEYGRSVDSAPRLKTLLKELILTGIPDDTTVECPVTGDLNPAREYILPLATARDALGWHILYGEIYRTGIRPESGSRYFEVRRGSRGTAHQALTVFVSPHLLDAVLGRIPVDQLVGRWIIVLADVGRRASWCSPAFATDVAIRRPLV